jgi:uncharacterized protein with PIN domain
VVYLDTSSLLKLIWLEEDSEAVTDRVSREDAVLVSSLTELESGIQITAAHLRGDYSLARSRRLHRSLKPYWIANPLNDARFPAKFSAWPGCNILDLE